MANEFLFKGFANNFAISNFAATSQKQDRTVFVELAEKARKANVVRDGKQVPSVAPEKNKVQEALGELQVILPTRKPRVFDQSIEAGVRVSAGTTVDLVMAPRDDINLGIFEDVHIATQNTRVGQFVEGIQQSNELVNLVLKYDRADEVNDTDKTRMTTLLAENTDVQIDETAAGQGFTNAFKSMQVALAFK